MCFMRISRTGSGAAAVVRSLQDTRTLGGFLLFWVGCAGEPEETGDTGPVEPELVCGIQEVEGWDATTDLPVARASAGVVTARDAYVIVAGGWDGGRARESVFVGAVVDGQIPAWTQEAPLPKALLAPSMASSGSLLAVVGGVATDGLSDAVYTAEVQSSGAVFEWVSGEPLPEALAYGAAVFVGEELVVTGGTDGSAPVDRVWVGALQDGVVVSWSPGPTMTVPLQGHGLTQSEGRLFAVGGEVRPGTASEAILTVDWAGAGEWGAIRALDAGLARPAVASTDGRLWIVGGLTDGLTLSSGLGIELVNDERAALPDLPGPRGSHGLVAVGSELFVVGGLQAPAENPRTTVFVASTCREAS